MPVIRAHLAAPANNYFAFELLRLNRVNEPAQACEHRDSEVVWNRTAPKPHPRFEALGWSGKQLAEVMNAADRAIANWESGDPISPVYAAKLREIQTVYNELKQSMKPKKIGSWLLTEMDEFEGRSPADLIRKGETGRIWASLFYLRSGMPD